VFVVGVCGGQQGSGESCYERKCDLLEVRGCSAAVGETGGKEWCSEEGEFEERECEEGECEERECEEGECD
jgi:hypothetical protein